MNTGPLLTRALHEALLRARAQGQATLDCSLDLQRSTTTVTIGAQTWVCNGRHYPYPDTCRDRTVYRWSGDGFEPVSRYAGSLIKLVPTGAGPPTFEIDGIKMLVSARLSPYEDARRKVALIRPQGKTILDTCGGLGYFAVFCLRGGALRVQSYEKNADVIWLRSLNPWSPEHLDAAQLHERFTLTHADVSQAIAALPAAAFDAALHDPPRFGIAGELYSQAFYDQLARVLKNKAPLFHYTGTPNKLTSRRDLPNEVAARLQRAGFSTEPAGDGVLAVKTARGPR